MNSACSRLSDLPEDIGGTIFEEVVWDQEPSSWQVALVSKRIQSWVEPVLYRRVFLDKRAKLIAFHSSVVSHPTKPPNFFAMHVKSLAILNNSFPTSEQISMILQECKGVQILLIRVIPCLLFGAGLPPEFRVAFSMPLKRLSILLPGIKYLPHSSLRGLTHLELLFMTMDPACASWDWKGLEVMESLTHLCVRGPYEVAGSVAESGAFIRPALLVIPRRVRVIVLWVIAASLEGVEEVSGMDPRIIVLKAPELRTYCNSVEFGENPSFTMLQSYVDIKEELTLDSPEEQILETG
ncbi:hypothetical protein DFP72DRAFT_908122 [Ephemerocybe angulata]|uniref:F-box domain-containing protein n=1 Tax=Ephemerocybe angulata TaxID=980116 RepID=A0A8H6HS19_9AGAR|nr:hypothetical protein DFP72DRAFT_908122 [Tulosesus angulatus]